MKQIFLSPPHMSGNEQKYIATVFESNYIAPVGAMLNRFEAEIKKATQTKNALAVVNGTSAIHLALRVLGIGEGDDVLASTFTFIGSVSAVLYQKANPIFIDSDASWNLSPILLENYLQECSKKPKALILTHLYGQVAAIEKIVSICKKYDIYLIEDAAESLGATFEGRASGTFGDFGVYSFNGNKILTTSSGGVLVSDKKEWIKKASFYATQAKEDCDYYEHKEYGYNYRMSNILAAIGVAQMEVLRQRVDACREVFLWYKEEFSAEVQSGEITFMPELEGSFGNRWLTTLTFKKSDIKTIIKHLREHKIESRHLWKPMHLQELFQDATSVIDGTSEKLFQRGLCLPSGTDLSRNEVKRVASLVKEVM